MKSLNFRLNITPENVILVSKLHVLISDDLLTHCGHGDHEEVHTVPVAQALLVGEVGGVTAVLKLKVKISVI